MKILVNKNVRLLFLQLLLCIPASVFCSVLFAAFKSNGAASSVPQPQGLQQLHSVTSILKKKNG